MSTTLPLLAVAALVRARLKSLRLRWQAARRRTGRALPGAATGPGFLSGFGFRISVLFVRLGSRSVGGLGLFPPLTPALLLRGEGDAAEACFDVPAGRRAHALSSHGEAASNAGSDVLKPETPQRAPSPLNAERAGLRGGSTPRLPQLRRIPDRVPSSGFGLLTAFGFRCWDLRVPVAPLLPAVLLFFLALPARGIIITRTSATNFFTDLGATPSRSCTYVSYQINNNDGVSYASVWVTIGSFTGGSVGLAPTEDGLVDLGSLASGETKAAFFYLRATANTTTPQGHTVTVYNGPPSFGVSLASQTFSFFEVQDTIQANANKVTTVVTGPTPPELGGLITITIDGDSGTIGDAKIVAFTPAAVSTWPANVFEVYACSVTLSGGNSGTFSNRLLIPPASLPSSADTHYTAVYYLRAVGTTTSPTTVSPTAYISSGSAVKHTATDPATLPPIDPTDNHLLVRKSVTPTALTNGGTVTFTVTLTNAGVRAAYLDAIADTLPSVPTNLTYVAGSSTFNGAVIGDPYIAGQALTWEGPFTLPAGTALSLVFQASVPGTLGSYTNRAVASVGPSQIDTTQNTSDDAPATARLTVEVTADVRTTTSGPASALAGSLVTYIITLTNLGPATASNVVVLDTLPIGAGFVSASSGGLHTNGTVLWPILPHVPSGASSNFTVTLLAPASGTLTNTVRSTSTTLDLEAGNNDGTAPDAWVVTVIQPFGSVSGFVYLDANRNGFKDSSEPGTGLGLFVKIVAATNAGGPALQAVSVSGASGAFTITNVLAGTYTLLLDDNDTVGDVTPTLPAGWLGTEMSSLARSNVVVVGANLPDQNFGLVNGVALCGRVFKDTGEGGGTAHDGVVNGGEQGLAGVTVKLTDTSGATVHDTTTTDGAGQYTLLIPDALAAGTVLKVAEVNPSGHLSGSGQAGNTGGGYDRDADAVTFSFVPGTTYTNVNFGDVPPNSFQADSRQSGLPGTFVVHPHVFLAGSAGLLAFSVTNAPTPALSNWSTVLYRDANGNGQLDAGETVLPPTLTVTAGEKVGLLVKDFIPLQAPMNAQNRLTITATLFYTNASPSLTHAASLTDLTTVGAASTLGLSLVKAVDKAAALPGETLTYTLTYANQSGDVLRDVVLYDQTPAFTVFLSATNGPLPGHLTNCVMVTPAPGASGALRWTFDGTLAPAGRGTVTYRVTVAQ